MDYNEAFDAHRTHTKHAMKTMRDGIRLVGLLFLPFSPRAWEEEGKDDRGQREREKERGKCRRTEVGHGFCIFFNGKSNHYD